jgi:hypothetical protein
MQYLFHALSFPLNLIKNLINIYLIFILAFFHYFSVFSNLFYYQIILQSVGGLIIVIVPLRQRSLRTGTPPALYSEFFVLQRSNLGANIIYPGRDFSGRFGQLSR